MAKPKDMVITITLTIPSDTPFMRVASGVSLLANHLQPGSKVGYSASTISFKVDVSEIPQEQAA